MTDLPAAHAILPAGSWTGADDRIALTYDARFLRRKRLTTEKGLSFLVDLAETVSLAQGDGILLTDDRVIEVQAADEPLLEVVGDDLARLAWHIGNRHTPCQFEPGRLLILRDQVLADMLERLGAHVHSIDGPFSPEGGAYGLGRTLGHDHGPVATPAEASAGQQRHVHTQVHTHVSHHHGEDEDAGAEVE